MLISDFIGLAESQIHNSSVEQTNKMRAARINISHFLLALRLIGSFVVGDNQQVRLQLKILPVSLNQSIPMPPYTLCLKRTLAVTGFNLLPTNLLASLDALTQFIWDNYVGLQDQARLLRFI